MNDTPSTPDGLNRRAFLTSVTGFGWAASIGTGGLGLGLGLGRPAQAAQPHPGRLKQAVCRGVFRGLKLDLDGECREAAAAGAVGMDLVGPDAFPTLKKYGLMPTMVGGGSGIKSGINDRSNHGSIDPRMREAIKATAAFGAPNVIVMAGDRKGLTDEEGLDNSVLFLNQIKGLAEDLGVTLCLELLNSKVNHPGYMADRTAWGVELCKRVNSPRVKLLYDIYHMQIMEGDIIRTVRDNIQWIGHFHTAGNPGRHEFDHTQELNYPPICKAIADLGFQGYLAHEYTPTRDPLGTLRAMLKLCEV
ncbi:MAG: TIM barrel protein [Verrucomicrobia bacterium]|nr:TIM barrel protein [Verrucomicrobiota bacterium]